MQFQGIGGQAAHQRRQLLRPQHLLVFFDQPQGAGPQAAAAAVAALGEHSAAGANGPGGTNPGTGPRTVPRATVWIEKCLAEVGILPITKAEHQPGGPGQALAPGPVDAPAHRGHHRPIGRHIEAMGAGQAGQAS